VEEEEEDVDGDGARLFHSQVYPGQSQGYKTDDEESVLVAAALVVVVVVWFVVQNTAQ
jgi:hypothetical protein